MIMNRKLTQLAGIAFMLAILPLAAQHKDHHDKVKAYRVSFFTQELELSVEEAEKFWPLFRIYDAQKDSLHRQYFRHQKQLQDSLAFLNEQEAATLLENQKKKELQVFEDKYKTLEAMEAVIGSKKTLQLLHLEHRFRKQLLHKMRKKDHSKKEK